MSRKVSLEFSHPTFTGPGFQEAIFEAMSEGAGKLEGGSWWVRSGFKDLTDGESVTASNGIVITARCEPYFSGEGEDPAMESVDVISQSQASSPKEDHEATPELRQWALEMAIKTMGGNDEFADLTYTASRYVDYALRGKK